MKHLIHALLTVLVGILAGALLVSSTVQVPLPARDWLLLALFVSSLGTVLVWHGLRWVNEP